MIDQKGIRNRRRSRRHQMTEQTGTESIRWPLVLVARDKN